MEKKAFIIIIVAAAVVTFATGSGATSIADRYWGGTPTHNFAAQDVVGDPAYYDIRNMDVNFSGANLRVDIYSTFFGQLDSPTIWNDRTKMGDLFISSSGWKPNTSAPDYRNDTYLTTGTNWNYVVALAPQGVPFTNGDTTRSGQAALYAIGAGSVAMSGLNGLDPAAYAYRADQLVRFNPASGATPLATGTWNVSDVSGSIYDMLSINIDYMAILNMGSNWGFHWTMSCGNDVIEGEAPYPTPEPSSILLVAAGLLAAGLLGMKQRRLASVRHTRRRP